MVSLVEMDIDEHDRAIAYILGLSHALNIAFFNVLADSGETLARLMELSSTTFDRQMAVALQVASENPYLYYEIQALNEFGGEPLRALREAAARLEATVASADEEGFVDLMRRGERLGESRKRGERRGS
jgi:chorismate mutase/prephenate dehydrogenase